MGDFLAALDSSTRASVDTTTLTRAMYSTDASIYRVVPTAVARPHDGDEVEALLNAAYRVDLPVTARGSGTSCAGNAVGAGLVIDFRRHMNHIHRIDPQAKTAEVDPGVVQETLQNAVKPYNVRFGPDPSTSSRCTIGGIIANNACGPRALGYGVAATNLIDATIHTGTGQRLNLSQLSGAGARSHRLSTQLADLIDANLAPIRTQCGHFSRQVSGYGLQHLLPENGRDLARFFAGSEGTLGVATRLTVRLVADPPHTLTVALGYPTMADAADAVTSILAMNPTAVEGMDSRLVDVVRDARGSQAVPPLPAGQGWMFIELGGNDTRELRERADRLIAASGCLEGWRLDDPRQADTLWKIRSDGAGLAGVSLSEPAYPGWEDAAVPPDKLGSYLRGFEELLDAHGFHALPYGHFGEGCVHARIDFPLTQPGGSHRYRAFVTDCARLVASFGGSLSGEHGDGRARSDLLPLMYSPEVMALFAGVKRIFDPSNHLNPGVIVAPARLDDQIRYTGLIDNPVVETHGDFAAQVHRCTGVGKCVGVHHEAVMCPAYQATGEEKDSPRGRARVLQEMVNGTLLHGWDSPEVAAVLDSCLACKGCSSDCPTGIDMAAAKSYALDQRYHGSMRPRSHYALGWLPRWGRLVTRLRLGAVANAVLGLSAVGGWAKWLAGVDSRRALPRFATQSGRRRAAAIIADPRHEAAVTQRQPVVVWVDSFTDCFEGTALPAMIKVLLAAGYAPRFLERTACCGLTWITTGQRSAAARHIRAALDQLAPIAAAGTPIVAMEPSCLAVWRSDAAELVVDSRLSQVRDHLMTLAELLTQQDQWTPPDLSGHEIIAQPHCHQASVIGWAAEAQLLDQAGATVTTLNGCCGLAGNFGVEIGHHEMSVAVAETHLLPALREQPEAIVLADGFSCRKQVSDLSGREAVTLAELLASHIPALVSPAVGHGAH